MEGLVPVILGSAESSLDLQVPNISDVQDREVGLFKLRSVVQLQLIEWIRQVLWDQFFQGDDLRESFEINWGQRRCLGSYRPPSFFLFSLSYFSPHSFLTLSLVLLPYAVALWASLLPWNLYSFWPESHSLLLFLHIQDEEKRK